jgi:hypothetical protein
LTGSGYIRVGKSKSSSAAGEFAKHYVDNLSSRNKWIQPIFSEIVNAGGGWFFNFMNARVGIQGRTLIVILHADT